MKDETIGAVTFGDGAILHYKGMPFKVEGEVALNRLAKQQRVG